MIANILANKIFKIKIDTYSTYIFRHNAITHLINYNVNITFICTGKFFKACMTSFIAILALLWWSGTKPYIINWKICKHSDLVENFFSSSSSVCSPSLSINSDPLYILYRHCCLFYVCSEINCKLVTIYQSLFYSPSWAPS